MPFRVLLFPAFSVCAFLFKEFTPKMEAQEFKQTNRSVIPSVQGSIFLQKSAGRLLRPAVKEKSLLAHLS